MKTIDLPDNIKTCIIEHLEIVTSEFRSYLIDYTLHVLWCKDPFSTETYHNAEEVEDLEKFKISNAMKLAFITKTEDSSFWLSVHDLHPLLSKKASVILVQFATTNVCKAGYENKIQKSPQYIQ